MVNKPRVKFATVYWFLTDNPFLSFRLSKQGIDVLKEKTRSWRRLRIGVYQLQVLSFWFFTTTGFLPLPGFYHCRVFITRWVLNITGAFTTSVNLYCSLHTISYTRNIITVYNLLLNSEFTHL
jgi:hypothetical protein